jgi:hypothetical protein
MNLNDLESRVRRLDQLSHGLAKEVLLWKEGNDPLLYRERQDYLAAIQAALSGSEGTCVKRVGESDRRAQGSGRQPGGLFAWDGNRREERSDE